MITENDVKLAAKKWAIDTKKKFPHLSEPEFIAGATWAFDKLDPLCMEGAQLIEKVLAENERLRAALNRICEMQGAFNNLAPAMKSVAKCALDECTTPST